MWGISECYSEGRVVYQFYSEGSRAQPQVGLPQREVALSYHVSEKGAVSVSPAEPSTRKVSPDLGWALGEQLIGSGEASRAFSTADSARLLERTLLRRAL
ncbi:hypothetical protein chiPu_0021698 [Chiloscyllium punctatum]|uniref:Uncharacterized protein n=1 Tax=Chiloscyllium punctatum TaxID=137246 RepID=A0A401RKL9_CHIPU|nr:hypothetical protein [Chiloscyllium punctatum]